MGRITEIKTLSASTPIQWWQYDYTEMNNINSRTDNITGQSETFEYDNLNRLNNTYLDNSYVSNYLTQEIDYDFRGNITTKTDAGNYVYGNASKPNQLTKITDNPFTITTDHDIKYYINGKTKSVTQEQDKIEFTYGPDLMRVKTKSYSTSTLLQTKYFALGNYEEEIDETSGITTKYYYISGGDGLAAIYKQQGSAAGSMYNVHKDHLGSIDLLTDENGNVAERYAYDAWGNRRNPVNWQLPDTRTNLLISIGYTAQEHLAAFGLINLNGRMYEPLTARFLSPDNYIQDATKTQGYNRYTYCVNNPLKYTDPSGEFFIWDSWVTGFIHGFFSTSSGRWSSAWNNANQRAGNDMKIWGGLFVSDPNRKTKGGRIWEVVSRLTWQLPQTIGGFTTSHAYNTFGLGGGVESVKYKYGATVVKTRNYWGGVTQGSYIVGGKSIEANPNNPLFQHEYGHYIQSQSMGFAYYGRVGIPSICSIGDHDFHPVEQDANRRAFLYFNQNVEEFQDDATLNDNKGWNFSYNPLDVNKSGQGIYIDYQNENSISLLNNLKVTAKWYDYIFPIVSGFYNVYQYNY